MKELKGHFEARLAAYNKLGSGEKLTLLIHPQEVPAELVGLPWGSRLMIAWTAIGDDEKPALAQPVAKEKAPRERRRFHDLPLSQQAAIRCGDERFQKWLVVGDEETPDAETAASIVRFQCHITSRRELDTNAEAAVKWKLLNDAFETEVQGYAEMVR